MHVRGVAFVLAQLAVSFVLEGALAQQPVNLSDAKSAVVRYHDSGRWNKDLDRVEGSALHWVAVRYKHVEKPAIVLDIDDTSLSTWPEEKATDFGYVAPQWDEWEKSATAPAIPATVRLFRFAKAHGISVFFVTGRRETSRAWTEKNLNQAGFAGFIALYLRPVDDNAPSVSPFKSGCRRKITKLGYTIVANLGDQQSDLAGGFSERAFKLPNPMYFLP